jgi:hypothetical protein
VTKIGKDHCTSIFFGCVCDVEKCDLLIESSFNNPPERKIGKLGKEDWELIERKIGNFSGRRLFMRGSKVMLIVKVRLQFNYLYLEDFCNFGFYRSGSVSAGFWFKIETEPDLLKFMVLTIGFSFRFGFFG